MMNYITGEAVARGNPHLKAGIVVVIQGGGDRFDGKYLIVGASHPYSHARGCAQYLPAGVDPRHPYVAPLNGDLTGFPPSILVVGTLDPLLSDTELFAAALEKAGAPVELHVFEDAIHAFVQMPMLDMAGEAIAKLCAFARQRVSQGAAPVRDRGRT